MQEEKFTLMQYSVSAILGLIEAGQFVIPEIQRPFVWKKAQVRDLIDSLYNGYPTGYIITWKNPDVHTKDGAVANGRHVLIDGQQRITALMAAVSGMDVLDVDFNKDRIKIAFNPLATEADKRFAFRMLRIYGIRSGFRIFQNYLKRILNSGHLKMSMRKIMNRLIWMSCRRRF